MGGAVPAGRSEPSTARTSGAMNTRRTSDGNTSRIDSDPLARRSIRRRVPATHLVPGWHAPVGPVYDSGTENP
jgi:hypothetical protein